MGKAIASSNAFVCKDCVPPNAAAMASMQVGLHYYTDLVR